MKYDCMMTVTTNDKLETTAGVGYKYSLCMTLGLKEMDKLLKSMKSKRKAIRNRSNLCWNRHSKIRCVKWVLQGNLRRLPESFLKLGRNVVQFEAT